MTARVSARRNLLLVDVGNSKVQVVLLHGGDERRRWRVDYGRGDWRRQFAAAAASARGTTPARLRILVASVAPARARAIDAILRRTWNVRPHRVDWRDPWPFRIAVRSPWTLGADRLANVAGLRALGMRDGVAVDVGTAVTIDVLDDGGFTGGLILPGAALAARALHAHTEKLPLVRTRADVPLVGQATEAALQAGIFHGLVHAVSGITRALVAARRARRVVLTGGMAPLLVRHLPHAHLEPDLLFLGLRALAPRAFRVTRRRPGAPLARRTS